ncbi:MAG: RnfABCDGE type electron transport complex subunit C [Oscillospiraceae bacterium]|nr:RnfABCDGE type electron transport complex subunit C [Oscillospiraceae bacterium]
MIINTVTLPVHNNSAEKATVTPELPEKVIISMAQSIGAPCEPLVKPGDRVLKGQLIGDSSGNVSAPVHASVSGKVSGETEILNISGKLSRAIVIETDSIQELHPDIKPPTVTDRESFLKAVRDSGSVGLGGAGFPTHLKLDYDRKRATADTLIINAAECEPFITSDYREIMELPHDVIEGIRLVMKYIGIPKALIGIEGDKPDAIEKMREVSANFPEITVKQLPAKYPQGAEKVIVYQMTGKLVKKGKLPLDSGCIVMNVSTISFLAEYMRTGIPLITRRVTIDGDEELIDKENAKNVFVPVGTTLEHLRKIAGLKREPARIIIGGPMMGSCVYDMNTPVVKTTGSVLFLGEPDFTRESPCIRCGKCIHVCSINLNPYEINRAYDAKNVEMLKKLCADMCMSCASCSFICPAKRHISEKGQLAKQLVLKK